MSVALNINRNQADSVPKSTKQEIISFQASQIPTYGAPFSVFIRNSGGIMVHEAVLCLTQASAISGLTGSVANFPNVSPLPFHFTTVDIIINGVIVDSRRGDELWLLNQLTTQDEQRLFLNYEMGNYTSPASRSALNTSGGKYYLPLNIPILNASHFQVLSPNTEIEIKFNMNSSTNVINQSTLTGTPILTWASGEILTRCTRLPASYVQQTLASIPKAPKHYLYHRLQYAPYALNSGITNTSITLSTLNGNISHLMFVVRPNNAITNLTQWSYTQVSQFEIKGSDGNSLTGGRPILDRESRLNHGRYWAKSSYLTEAESGVSNAYVYVYSFSADPIRALATGAKLNSYKFQGQELLNVI